MPSPSQLSDQKALGTWILTHTHTSCAMTTEHCFEVTTYTHPYEYCVKVSHMLQLFPATNQKNIKKLLCNSYEYFNIRLRSLGCDAV